MKIFFTILFISISCYIYPQELMWTNSIKGSGEVYPVRCVSDNQGNIIVYGRFDNALNSPSSISSYGAKDLFLAKYDRLGNLLWINHIGGSSTEQANGLTIDAQGDIYITGRFQSTCSFGNSTLISSGGVDIFLAKFSSLGSLIWVTPFGTGASFQGSQGLSMDKDGNLVLLGFFQTNIDLKGTILSESTATYTNFIAKIDQNANLIWAKKIVNKDPNCFFYGLSCSNNGYYLSASLIDTVYLDIAKVGSKKNISGNYSYDILLYKTDYEGNGQWYSKISGAGDDANISTESDPQGNVYVTGYYNSTNLTIDSISSTNNTPAIVSKVTSSSKGSYDIFFAKYNSAGVLQWFNSQGSTGDDRLTRLSTNGNHIVIAGQYGGSMTFNNEPLNPVGGVDAIGIVHDSNDNLLYAISAGGSGADVAQTCVIDNDGNFIFVGDYTSPTITFDSNHSLTNPDPGKDMFIAKYKSRSISFVTTNVLCNGSATGSATANPKGAWAGDLTYAWTKNGDPAFTASAKSLNNLTAGTYNCTVSSGLYSETASVTITEPAILTASENIASHQNAKCFGALDGALSLTVTGGTGTKNYVWTGNGTGIIATNTSQNALSAGTYSATVTDANGCTATVNNMVVTQPAKVIFKNTAVTKINGAQGAVDLAVQGGTPAFTYSWTGPSGYTASTEDITGLTVAGNYKVTLTDQNLCNIDTTVLIVDSHSLYAYVSQKTDVSCKDGSDASLTVTAETSDASPSFTYAWTGPDGFTATTAAITSLKAGTYNVTVTDVTPDPDKTYTITGITVTQPSVALALTTGTGNVTCFGLTDGFVDANATGGTYPYSYQWKKDGVAITDITEVITGLGGGNYEVTVTDAKNCTVNGSSTVNVPGAITVSSAVVTPVTCNGTKNDGAIALNVAGGTGSYTFRWSNGLTTQNISLLSAGTYNCIIRDANNCSITTQQTVGQPSAITASFTNTHVSCYSGSNGAIDLTPAGGNSGAYTYLWSNNQTSEDVTGLTSGSYSVTITDSKNCEKTFNTSITQPADLVIGSPVIQNANCNGAANGSISVSATGGTGPYLWSWSDSQIGATASNLTAGNYSVTVTDSKNCTKNAGYTITEPTALNISEVTASHINVACNGAGTGALEVIASGSTGTYEYSINGTTWQSSAVFSNLIAGNYNAMVRDQSVTSCTKTIGQAIAISQPTALSFTSTSATNITCNGLTNGAINAPATGGTGALSYKLKLSGVESSNTSGAATGSYTGLASATGYTVEVTDANNCKLETGNLGITEPQAITLASANATNITCAGLTNGAINAQANGGTGALSYKLLLSDVETGNTTGATTGSFTGLAAGTTYKITVTDANNCGPVNSTLLSIASPQALAVGNLLANNISCAGLTDGRIDIQATGGNGTYTFKLLLNNTPHSNITGASSGRFTGLSAGTGYTVEINDANNCGPVVSNAVNIQEPAQITIVSQTATNASGAGISDGSINIIASGGTGLLVYTLNTGATQNSGGFTGLPTGTYQVSITDYNNCGPVTSNSLIIDSPTSIDPVTGATIRLYPNPVTEKVFVEVRNQEFRQLKVELKNISGQASLTQKYEDAGDGFVAEIDLTQLPKGIYVIMVNNSVLKDKLIVQ